MSIHSTAFPAHIQQIEHSQVHKQLKDATYVSQEVILRPFRVSDASQLRDLNKEWFPISYGEGFYAKLSNLKSRCWVAECQITIIDTKIKVIVGAIVYEYTDVDSGLLAKESWMDFVMDDSLAIYVMTLGVIDEFRSKGVASKLLEKLLTEAKQEPRVKYINLHVVSYNSACKFYEKNRFQREAEFPAYYHIGGVEYTAMFYVMFVNGGKRRQGWAQWLKRLIWQQP